MERRMAKAIKPFFDRMPKLTAAQKAAAVHLGHFPASENIGVDVAAVQLASSLAARGGDGADSGLIPVGEALGADTDRPRVLAMPDKSPRRRPGATDIRMSDRKTSRRAKKKEADSRSRAELASASGSSRAPAFASAKPVPVPPPTSQPGSAPEPVPVKSQPEPAQTADIKPESKSPAPGFQTALGISQPPVLVSQTIERKVEIAGRKPVLQPEVRETVESPSVIGTRTGGPVNLINFDLAQSQPGSNELAPAARPLADIIRGIDIPDEETRTEVVPVDLDEIEPAKPQPKIVAKPVEKAPVKPKEPEHPKRYWVQIATGSNLDALKFDYRRMTKKQPDLFKSQKAWTSPWGRTRRLVVGPFDDFKAAKAFEADYRKDGGDGFAWASADGVEVNELTK
jgi:hypothetical protein